MDRSNGLMHIPFDVMFGFSKGSQWVLSDATDCHPVLAGGPSTKRTQKAELEFII
jgi:hypothetical protein